MDERLGIKRIAMKHLTLTAVSLLLIGLTMSGTAYSQVPVWEREALIAIYNATGGDNWSNNTGWNGAAGTECDWAGVTCSSGVVTKLVFSGGWYFSGSLPPEFGNLTGLTELDLRGAGSRQGSIPAELGNPDKLNPPSVAKRGFHCAPDHIMVYEW